MLGWLKRLIEPKKPEPWPGMNESIRRDFEGAHTGNTTSRNVKLAQEAVAEFRMRMDEPTLIDLVEELANRGGSIHFVPAKQLQCVDICMRLEGRSVVRSMPAIEQKSFAGGSLVEVVLKRMFAEIQQHGE